MPHQIALTIFADVKPGRVDTLRRVLAELGNDPATGALPFTRLDMVHFARLFVLDRTEDLTGKPLPARLVFLTDLDAPVRRYLGELVDLAGGALDRIYDHCEGYPAGAGATRARRLAYLGARTVRAATVYVNTIGRSVDQVRREATLREAIQSFLDRPGHQWAGRSPAEVRAAVQEFVTGREDLAWARRPPKPPAWHWRLKERLHLVAVLLLLLILAPLLALAAPFWLVALRRHERADPVPEFRTDHARDEQLAALEDRVVQNQLSAVGFTKPGRFRLLTTVGALALVNVATRHFYNRGSLAGITTIHFARWVLLDDRRRLVFASNYDGSLESYMDDFIDKVAWGLNAVFSNGMGYPRTRWLVKDGAKDEQAFKKFLRGLQVPTQFWYAAYDHLTAVNVANNAAVRAGLFGAMSNRDAERWLRRL
jgi:hypothetical protein